MTRFLLLVCLAAFQAPAAPQVNLAEVLRKVETRYNNARTLQVSFEQRLSQGRTQKIEKGELYLRKPGRMRWQYTQPAGKLFVSDGKYVYMYSPISNRVEKTRVKETDDMRAPLAFLLGKLDFQRDFKKFTYREDNQGLWVVAEPKSERMPYTDVAFLVDPTHSIRRLQITGQDQSVMEFHFDNEKRNPALSQTLFSFQAPAGAEFVEEFSAEAR